MSGNPYGFLFGPFVAFAVVGVLVLLLRWAFSSGGSLIERTPHVGDPDQYGLLVPIAAPADPASAERLAHRLEDAGLRVTVAPTDQGLRVMVFAEDEQRARDLLR